MKQYTVTYRVVIKAKDDNDAEMKSVDLEGDIRHLHKWVKDVCGDPYMEEVE